MLLRTIQQAMRHPQLAILAAALVLAGCGAPNSGTSTPTPQPTAPATAAPTSVAQPTAVVQPTAPATAAPTSAAQPTAVVQPTTAPTSAGQPTAAATPISQADPTAVAVQTVIDYYTDINQKKLDDAYQLWANNGAASGQTLDQFKQGFANTAGVSIELGDPKNGSAANTVDVPVQVIAIANDPNPSNPQKVQQFRGTYTVQLGTSGGRIASANVAEVTDRPLPPAELSDPVKLLQNYYDLINRKQLATAYTFWSDNGANTNQSFAQFAQGYATTSDVKIDLGQPQSNGAAGSLYADVPTVIVATHSDGSQQAFCGTYTLRKLNVPPFDQFGLHIESAAIAPIALVQPGSDQAKQLLANGCKQS